MNPLRRLACELAPPLHLVCSCLERLRLVNTLLPTHPLGAVDTHSTLPASHAVHVLPLQEISISLCTGNVDPAARPHRATLRRRHRRLGQPAGRHTRGLLHAAHTQVVRTHKCRAQVMRTAQVVTQIARVPQVTHPSRTWPTSTIPDSQNSMQSLVFFEYDLLWSLSQQQSVEVNACFPCQNEPFICTTWFHRAHARWLCCAARGVLTLRMRIAACVDRCGSGRCGGGAKRGRVLRGRAGQGGGGAGQGVGRGV